jgi:hypothetical protein
MSTQPSLFPSRPQPKQRTFDICKSRHKGNAQSVEANPSDEQKSEEQARVFAFIKGKGLFGATSKEVAAHLRKNLNCVSGRCSELKEMGLVFPNGQRRDRCGVLVAGVSDRREQ